ncbi:MAG: hypothetical protein ACI9EW_000965 [Cellvibrionaceae bacterium]|jgi:hypothetical protein
MTDKEITILNEDPKNEGSFMTNPLSEKGVPRWLVMIFSVIGFIYILNPTAGLVELIPDIVPFVGNLDEGGAFLLIWYGLLEIVEGRKNR